MVFELGKSISLDKIALGLFVSIPSIRDCHKLSTVASNCKDLQIFHYHHENRQVDFVAVYYVYTFRLVNKT